MRLFYQELSIPYPATEYQGPGGVWGGLFIFVFYW
jgi:hypothetical protein